MTDNLPSKLLYIYCRLREPSSQVAFGGAFAIISKYVPAEVLSDGLSVVSLVFFTLGVFFKEGKPETDLSPSIAVVRRDTEVQYDNSADNSHVSNDDDGRP